MGRAREMGRGRKLQEADLDGQTGQGGDGGKAEDGVETGAVILDGFDGEAKASDYTGTTSSISDGGSRSNEGKPDGPSAVR